MPSWALGAAAIPTVPCTALYPGSSPVASVCLAAGALWEPWEGLHPGFSERSDERDGISKFASEMKPQGQLTCAGSSAHWPAVARSIRTEELQQQALASPRGSPCPVACSARGAHFPSSMCSSGSSLLPAGSKFVCAPPLRALPKLLVPSQALLGQELLPLNSRTVFCPSQAPRGTVDALTLVAHLWEGFVPEEFYQVCSSPCVLKFQW